jgi:hypothetical protein
MIGSDEPCPVHPDPAARPVLAGDDLSPSVEACAHCARAWQEIKALRDLGRSLPWSPPDAPQAARMRAAIVASMSPRAAPPRIRRRLMPVAVGALAALSLAIVALYARHPGRSPSVEASRDPAPLSTVRAVGIAHFERSSPAPDETVRLLEGRIHVTVAHLGPSERFRVLTADAVVEVRGTEFELEASADRLQAVAVERGRVEVRVATRAPELLVAGARWTAPRTPAAADTPAPFVPPVPDIAPGPARHSPPRRSAIVRTPDHRSPTPDEISASSPPPATATPQGSPAKATPVPEPTAPHPKSSASEHPAPPSTSQAAPASRPLNPGPSEVDSRRLEREDRREERRERREDRRRERLERRR